MTSLINTPCHPEGKKGMMRLKKIFKEFKANE